MLFGGNATFDEPMSRHTSFRVGGPAEAYVLPDRYDQLFSLVAWCRENGHPLLVIGGGTNLLVKDGGISGVVIDLSRCLNAITPKGVENDGVFVSVMAGARMKTLCSFALSNGLGGMNFAIGIPGTVGGGIQMNAGTGLGWMADVIASITVLMPGGDSRVIQREHLRWAYRKLEWSPPGKEDLSEKPIILEGRFCLQPAEPSKLKKEACEIMKARMKRQPMGLPSAGCCFKNPSSENPAGRLIEDVGLKGRRVGGAEISSKHANFIINTGKAAAADILALMADVQERVSKMFNIDLESEVQIVGE